MFFSLVEMRWIRGDLNFKVLVRFSVISLRSAQLFIWVLYQSRATFHSSTYGSSLVENARCPLIFFFCPGVSRGWHWIEYNSEQGFCCYNFGIGRESWGTPGQSKNGNRGVCDKRMCDHPYEPPPTFFIPEPSRTPQAQAVR